MRIYPARFEQHLLTLFYFLYYVQTSNLSPCSQGYIVDSWSHGSAISSKCFGLHKKP
nr:MAG TPA: hypothetical protein [Caudoviricetes sp.]